ncbi:MAG TPA: type II secretion system protein GspM [Xanthomonadales bacterium]|nr:type II secretion system protein GspM [Xanthomonadales bacterium]
MALAVEQGNSRLTAILLFAIVVILVYLLAFHWFILRHVEYSSEISDLEDQLGRFTRVAAMKDVYDERLRELQSNRSDQNLFLEEGGFNEAAAAMSERLGQAVDARANNSCQIVSRQPVRPRVQERYEKVTVNVRMRCGIEDVNSILYWLETSVPLIIIEEMTIVKPRARRSSRRNQQQQDTGQLDVRFNMSGYLR